jgi:hypothetical protein
MTKSKRGGGENAESIAEGVFRVFRIDASKWIR